MQNKNVFIVIVLLIIGTILLYVSFSKPESDDNASVSTTIDQTPPSAYTSTVNNAVQSYHPQQNADVAINSKTKTAFGVTLDVPNGLSFASTMTDDGVNAGLGNISIRSGNRGVLSINKYPSQARFDEYNIRDSSQVLIDGNYSIGGTTGLLYKDEGGELFMIIPSKLVMIFVSPIWISGVSQEKLDHMVASIKL